MYQKCWHFFIKIPDTTKIWYLEREKTELLGGGDEMKRQLSGHRKGADLLLPLLYVLMYPVRRQANSVVWVGCRGGGRVQRERNGGDDVFLTRPKSHKNTAKHVHTKNSLFSFFFMFLYFSIYRFFCASLRTLFAFVVARWPQTACLWVNA